MFCRLLSSFSSSKIVIAVVVICLSLSLTHSCFIRNCPKGGKRALDSAVAPKRECMRCGENGAGICVGPAICCSPALGCHINTAQAKTCRQEDSSLTPCYVPGQPCGDRHEGTCVAENVCCTSESCAINERCRLKSALTDELDSTTNIRELIQMLLRRGDVN